ncbi:MAG: hypothetical protein ACYDIC_15465 [Desulfobaccales bacterium]
MTATWYQGTMPGLARWGQDMNLKIINAGAAWENPAGSRRMPPSPTLAPAGRLRLSRPAADLITSRGQGLK